MSECLTIVARIGADPERVEFAEAELSKLIEPTLNEAGCIRYDLHRDNDDPAVLLLYENRQNRDPWQAHLSSLHVAAYAKATEGALAGFSPNEMTRL